MKCMPISSYKYEIISTFNFVKKKKINLVHDDVLGHKKGFWGMKYQFPIYATIHNFSSQIMQRLIIVVTIALYYV